MAKKETAPAVTPRIVAAAGVAVRSRTGLSKAIEAAMSQAVLDANAEGIATDNTDEIKPRIDAARERVIREYREAEAKAAAAAKAKAEAEAQSNQ